MEAKKFFLTYCCLRLNGYTSNRISRYLLSLANSTEHISLAVKLITASSFHHVYRNVR